MQNLFKRSDVRKTTIAAGVYWLVLFGSSLLQIIEPFSGVFVMPVLILAGLPIFALAGFTLYRSIEDRPAEPRGLAYVDDLTGLQNRRSFMAGGERLVLSSRPGASSLVLLDVDGLKGINDECGHQAGDELLREVALHLSAANPSVYRIGGDEFAILVDRSQGESVTALMRSLTPLDHHFQVCGHDHLIQFSYGFASRRENETFDELFSRADARLRQFKHRLYTSGARRERRIAHLVADGEVEGVAENPDSSAEQTEGGIVSIFSRKKSHV